MIDAACVLCCICVIYVCHHVCMHIWVCLYVCVCWPRACIRCLPLMSLQNFVFLFETGSLSMPETPPLASLATTELSRASVSCHFVLESHVGHHAWLKIILDLFVYFVHMCFSCMYACEPDGCLMLKGIREGIRTPITSVVSPILGLLVKAASTLNY